MDPIVLGTIAIAVMFVLILLHVPIGLAMAAVGLIGYGLLTSFSSSTILVAEAVTAVSSIDYAVIPLFILMGNFASAAGISADMYNMVYSMLGHRRGGLAMATVGGCGLFGSICGSSFATTATFGRIAMPEMLKRNYAPTLATGCIAGGGTLGSLVPPSIILVIYALFSEQYIIELFLAAIFPAILTIVLYFLAIIIYTRIYPKAGPAGDRMPWRERFILLKKSWSALFLMVMIGGGIYGGVFTVNEAAALGLILSLLFAFFRRTINKKMFWQILADTASTTAMIYTIMIGSSVFNYFIVLSHLPDVLTQGILGSGWPTFVIFIVILIVYIILGSVFDTIAAMIITLPFVLPVIMDMGYSPVWWGIINVVVIEIGMITPPIGINVFVLQGVARDHSLSTIYKGILPFLFADIVRLTILMLIPAITIWLPNILK